MSAAPVTAAAFASSLPAAADLWVFAYGSLMWDPGFPFLETSRGLLRGYHRRFCIYSVRYRGTPEQPGLVLGLDHGGACRGLLFRVAAEERAGVLETLWAREMVTGVYRPGMLPVRTDEGGVVSACAFTVNRGHPQYCRRLGLAESAALIRRGVGGRGPNLEYLANTVEHLEQLGIADHGLRALLKAASADPVYSASASADRGT